MDSGDIEAAFPQRRNHGVHRVERACDHQRAVEHQQRQRPAFDPFGLHVRKPGALSACKIESGIGHRHGIVRLARVMADGARGGAQEREGIGSTALPQIVAQFFAQCGGQGGGAIERRIGFSPIGYRGKGNAVLARDAGDLVDAVAPVAFAAEQDHADEFGVRDHFLDIEVDRVGMAQLQQVGEPNTRRRMGGRTLRQPRRCARKARQFTVGHSEDHHVAGRLVEVDRLLAVGDRPRRGGQQVHQASTVPRTSARPASMAARSSPFWPMTTSWVRRASCGSQARS